MTTRRQLLRGAGGFTLALPILPSLMPRDAEARLGDIQPRFVSITTPHGGVWGLNMCPGGDTIEETTSYAGHEIRRGGLVRSVQGDSAGVSSVIRGPSDVLTDALVAKMNVIRGLDIPFYIGHNDGGSLGNWAGNNGDGGDGLVQQEFPTPTIDQRMAWSEEFYPDLDTIRARSMVIGKSHSYRFTDPTNPGAVQRITAERSSLALFEQIFVPDERSEVDPRPLVADRIMENYQALRQGNRRLSPRDRVRLDEHIQRIDELQRRLSATASCGDVPVPTSDSEPLLEHPSYYVDPQMQAEQWQLFNDVVVAAFLCGTSRIAVMGIVEHFSTAPGEWHNDVAHQAHLPDGEAQAEIAASNQQSFEHVVLDLIAKLDVDEGDGSTLLDNTLLQWTQESGPLTHESVDSCIVTAGGAAGCVATGQYLDYRNLDSPHEDLTSDPVYSGLLYQQYLGHVLQAAGLSPESYEIEPGGGYPHLFIGEGRSVLYSDEVIAARGEMLPWLSS